MKNRVLWVCKVKELSVHETVENAITWLKNNRTGGSWRIPVVSECIVSTALSLHVIEDDKKRNEIVDYLLNIKVWENNSIATSFFVTAVAEEDVKLAKDVIKKYGESVKESSSSRESGMLESDKLRRSLLSDGFPPLMTNIRNLARRTYYMFLFSLSPKQSWSKRTSLFYEYLPNFAPFLLEPKLLSHLSNRLETELVQGLNKDGSYAGNTVSTIKAAYILRQLGNEDDSKRAIRWLYKVQNDNGSFRPILYQDVYDTIWASLALSDDNGLDKTLKWLELTKVDEGYPYYSYSYYPDCDDTSLVLFLKNRFDCMGQDDYRSLEFLLKSQNPDDGWGFTPYFQLSHNPFSSLYKLVYSLSKQEYLHGLALWQGQCLSTVDMTSRVLITLELFKDQSGVKEIIADGVKFLFDQHSNGRFQNPIQWTDSKIFETSMALISLFRNRLQNKQTDHSVIWMLGQNIKAPEDIAHLLWALIEGDVCEDVQAKLVKKLVSMQLNDGSWMPSVQFFSGSIHGRHAKFKSPVFSKAVPLFVLHRYLEKSINK
jgi:hypothetical protein